MAEGASTLVGGSRTSKRRRLDQSRPDEAISQASFDAYRQHWTAAAAASLNVNQSPRWQRADPSAYPDLAAASQPSYIYQQAGRGSYSTGWMPTDLPRYAGAPATTSSYSAGEASAAPKMPYFPPTAPATAQLVDAVGATAFNHLDVPNATQYAYHAANLAAPRDLAKPGSAYYLDDAGMHLKIQSLPILENLATQLVYTISKASYPQIQDMMRAGDSEHGQAYQTLKNFFDQTRKVYSRETPFIDAIAIQMFQPTQQEIIRKANVATFVSSILGAHDVSFFYLNEFFLETFVPLGHRLLKWQGAIYLELKTQTYISALMNSDGEPEEMLDELFPPDLDAQILARHPDAPSLSPSEQDFIDRSRARRSYLLAEPRSDHVPKDLPKKYQWTDFVREFASCITKNVDGIMNVPVRSHPVAGNAKGANADLGGHSGADGASNGGLAAVQNLSIHGRFGGASGESRRAAPAASTVRQPWTKAEEDALLAGLERVHGPHWSQILALYGRGGSVSEVLKDRNQVQLKDKARNLKLWHLKTGREVPPSLRGVTGELRKRSGARARAALGITDPHEDQDADADEGENREHEKDATMRPGRRPKKKSTPASWQQA